MRPAAMIVYGEQSGIVRRIVMTGKSVTDLAGHYGPGESIIICNAEEVVRNGTPDLPRAVAMVAAKRGKPAEKARCVVLNDKTGEIEKVIAADPAMDRLPGKTLVQHASADVGWMRDAGTGEYVEPTRTLTTKAGDELPDGTLAKEDQIESVGGRRAVLTISDKQTALKALAR